MSQNSHPTVPAGLAPQPDTEAVRGALERLAAARDAGAAMSPLVGAAAEALGVSPRTVWRWLEQGLPSGAGWAWEPGEEDVDAFVRWKGNASAAWRERRATAGDTPGLRTFQAALNQHFEPGDLAALREGCDGRRRHQVYLRWEPEGRNELWEADHKQLDVAVLFPRARKPRKPWVTTFVDGYCRAVMGWAIDEYPSAATVLAALGEGIRLDETRGPFGGIPAAVRPDRGLEFEADSFVNRVGFSAFVWRPPRRIPPTARGRWNASTIRS